MLEKVFPFWGASKPSLAQLSNDPKKNLYKKFKIKSLGLGFHSGSSLYSRINKASDKFEQSPYDFDQIMQAIDTDSYVKQAFLKYKDLFWKEGWDIVSENPDATSYLYQRIDLFEQAMSRPFDDFLIEAVDQLVKFSNVFIVVVRGDLSPFYKVASPGPNIIGFYIIPTQTVRVHRDKFNRPIRYRQALEGHEVFDNSVTEPEWPAEDVIHLSLEKKPGYAFGTPYITAAMDDILSLRQIEQDILNLIHKELFPLYKYKVGTEEMPSSPEELEDAASELANLRVEGGLILPERHDVEVIGSEDNALEVSPYLSHFKERVAIGLGLFPHHLGMETSTSNRSATDRLDTALYDRIKAIQVYVEECVRLFVFNKLLREGGFDPMVHPSHEGSSDRCYMRFREIDIDTQIKKENHYMGLFNGNLIDWSETREKLAIMTDADPSQLLMSITTTLQTMAQLEVIKATPKPATANGGGAPAPKTPDGKASSTGLVPNLPNPSRNTGNKVAPANQYGKRTSPNIRHSLNNVGRIDESTLVELVELIDDENGEYIYE